MLKLNKAQKENRLDKQLQHLAQYKVLIIDEIGYLPVDHQGSNLLFQLIAKRYMNKSTIVTMLYLSGMLIDKKYQGKNISQEIIKSVFKQVNSDLISLRTQNIAMARSLLNLFSENLFEMPNNVNKDILKYLRKIEPFKNINEL